MGSMRELIRGILSPLRGEWVAEGRERSFHGLPATELFALAQAGLQKITKNCGITPVERGDATSKDSAPASGETDGTKSNQVRPSPA